MLLDVDEKEEDDDVGDYTQCFVSADHAPSTISAVLQMRKRGGAGRGSDLSKATQLVNGKDGTRTESVWILSPCSHPKHKAALVRKWKARGRADHPTSCCAVGPRPLCSVSQAWVGTDGHRVSLG